MKSQFLGKRPQHAEIIWRNQPYLNINFYIKVDIGLCTTLCLQKHLLKCCCSCFYDRGHRLLLEQDEKCLEGIAAAQDAAEVEGVETEVGRIFSVGNYFF